MSSSFSELDSAQKPPLAGRVGWQTAEERVSPDMLSSWSVSWDEMGHLEKLFDAVAHLLTPLMLEQGCRVVPLSVAGRTR